MLYNDKYHWLLIEDYALHVSAGMMRPQQQLHLMDTSTDTDRDTDTDELEPIESLMETLNFYMNTELTLAKRTPQDASYSLYDVWYVLGGWRGAVSGTARNSCQLYLLLTCCY